MGFIAQDVQRVAHALCTKIIPNSMLKHEQDDDPADGEQLCVDYQRMTVINASVIRGLIEKNKELTQTVQDQHELIHILHDQVEDIFAKLSSPKGENQDSVPMSTPLTPAPKRSRSKKKLVIRI